MNYTIVNIKNQHSQDYPHYTSILNYLNYYINEKGMDNNCEHSKINKF